MKRGTKKKVLLDVFVNLKLESQIKKAEYLVKKIEEANSLADELASKVTGLKIDIKF